MIDKIKFYQTKFSSKPVSKEVNWYFLETFLHHIITEEGQSCASLKNLTEAYQYLKSIDQDPHGLLDVCLINRLILNTNEAGKCSNKNRITCFKGEIYMYAEPLGLEAKIQFLIDRYNYLILKIINCLRHAVFWCSNFWIYTLLATVMVDCVDYCTVTFYQL